MAEVLTDAFVSINAVDVSDHVESVVVHFEAEVVESTAMGDAGKARKVGLKDWSVEINFLQDFAAGNLDEKLFALMGTNDIAIKVQKSKTDAISTSNPEYQGNGVIDGGYDVIAGGVGEMAKLSITFVSSDGLALIRDTTP